MPITVTFTCDGCFEAIEGIEDLSRTFTSVSGRDCGTGSWKYKNASEVVPEDWIAYDPYTGCCYCPKCWEEIDL